MDAPLIRSLKAAGKSVEPVTLADGSELLLLPYGGRILGLFAPGDRRNFYWVNPALRTAGSAREFLGSPRWQNTGGERTWLGPELAFFFPQFPDLSLYRPPPAFDRTTFRLRRQPGSVGLSAEFAVAAHRPPGRVKLRLAKWIEAAPNPLRNEGRSELAQGVMYAGYALRSVLELVEAPVPGLAVGLWSLVQLPPGGEMLIPTYGRVRPRVFFGRVPRGDLRAQRSLVRYRMRSAGEHKIGLRSVATTGRLGYFLESTGGQAELVVRNFFGNPSGEYVDAPWSDPADAGYGVEACSVHHPELGRFAELEHHAPAIGGGPTRTEDTTQIWAFRGRRDRIALVAERLLGARPAGTKPWKPAPPPSP